ncbi:MAG: hypothetical protein ACI8X5_004075, partial [Planctomycetota bacterium]
AGLRVEGVRGTAIARIEGLCWNAVGGARFALVRSRAGGYHRSMELAK